MCLTCNKFRSEWYRAMRFSPELAEMKKRELMVHLSECPQHQAQMRQDADGPPNPELTREQLEAMR